MNLITRPFLFVSLLFLALFFVGFPTQAAQVVGRDCDPAHDNCPTPWQCSPSLQKCVKDDGLPSTPVTGSEPGGTFGGSSDTGGGTFGGSPPSSSGGGLQNPLKFASLGELLAGILDLLSKIGAIVVVLMVVYSGFLFVAARGKPEDIAKARSALFWTVIGALIVLGAQALSLGIQATVDSLRAAT